MPGAGRPSRCWIAIPAIRNVSANSSAMCASRDFNEQFYRLFKPDWQKLCEEWQLMVANMEYGYDVARSAVDFTPGKPLPPKGAEITVAADRGWQNSGVRLEAGVAIDSPRRAATKSPKRRSFGGASRAGCRSATTKAARSAFCWPRFGPIAPPPGSTSALLHPTAIGLARPFRRPKPARSSSRSTTRPANSTTTPAS